MGWREEDRSFGVCEEDRQKNEKALNNSEPRPHGGADQNPEQQKANLAYFKILPWASHECEKVCT